MRNKYIWIALSIAAAMVAVVVVVFAGNPDVPPGPPESTYSYTLEDIYQRLDSGAAGTQIAFTEPISDPGTGTMHTLDDIMGVAPAVDDTNGATAGDVLTGTMAWGLTSGEWGLISGTIPNNGAVTMVPTTASLTITLGYHNGLGTVQGDADLVAGSIVQGVDLFGVIGTCRVVPATGQTVSYAAGDDGAYQLGCEPAVDPQSGPGGAYNRGFVDNGDGTVTDNLTGLVWLKDADCWGPIDWTTALTNTNNLAHGGCGLSDGSSAGDWRVPNIHELTSLIDPGASSPALPANHPFSNVQSSLYRSSTTGASSTGKAWVADLSDGNVSEHDKALTGYVWPVRDVQ